MGASFQELFDPHLDLVNIGVQYICVCPNCLRVIILHTVLIFINTKKAECLLDAGQI